MKILLDWIKKNGVSAAMIALIVSMLVFPDVKAWLMRQVASTGLLNPKIEKTENTTERSASTYDFTVSEEHGNQINTADLRGKVVFVNFWASWCPPCRAEFPSIQKFYEKYKDNPKMVFLTVNMDDDPAKGTSYLEKEKYSVPFFVPASNISKVVFEGALPTTLVLDKSGKIRMHHTGVADYSTGGFYQQIEQLLAE